MKLVLTTDSHLPVCVGPEHSAHAIAHFWGDGKDLESALKYAVEYVVWQNGQNTPLTGSEIQIG